MTLSDGTAAGGGATPRRPVEQALEQALEQARGEAARLVDDLRAEAAAVSEATEASPDDEHDAEGATIGYERARVAGLLERAERSLVEVDAALERLRSGTYGRCERCGAAIGEERLAALPTTTRCAACAAGPARSPWSRG